MGKKEVEVSFDGGSRKELMVESGIREEILHRVIIGCTHLEWVIKCYELFIISLFILNKQRKCFFCL